MKAYSILFPHYDEVSYKQLSDTTCHDLGLDELLPEMAEKPDEQNLIREVLSHMTSDPRVAAYRGFTLRHPGFAVSRSAST